MIHDVIIIGAGPCGLAVAARLRESTPSALFTDAEHARYWHRFTQVQTLEGEYRRQKRRHQPGNQESDIQSVSDKLRSILVLDADSDQWMHNWNARFEKLKISHLRSPLFFHCDPRDRDGLLEFSHFQGRTDEVEEITNVVGREVSKHHKKCKKSKATSTSRGVARHLHLDNRDQIDYRTPSHTLFQDHCINLVDHYNLTEMVQRARVTSINYAPALISTEGANLFTLTTATDQIFLARTVVVAIGAGSNPTFPVDHPFLGSGSAKHLFAKGSILPMHVMNKVIRMEKTSVVIIGGGLSSAQTVNLLINEHKISEVHLILRSKLKVKHFDVDLGWVTKLRNANMAAFWSADNDEERVEMLKAARNGGSIPPKWQKTLQQFQKAGRLRCWEFSRVVAGYWGEEAKTWTLEISTTASKGGPDTSIIADCNHKLHNIDHIICATGSTPDVTKVDFLEDLQRNYPIESVQELPKIGDDLAWRSDVPLFITGALGGLRLGPGAGHKWLESN